MPVHLNFLAPRSMKFVILAIIAVHLANFGEGQVTITPLIPGYCHCANLWIQKTVDKFGFSSSVTNGKLAKKIMNNFLDAANPDDNVGCFAKYPDFKYMFSVSKSLTATVVKFRLTLKCSFSIFKRPM